MMKAMTTIVWWRFFELVSFCVYDFDCRIKGKYNKRSFMKYKIKDPPWL